MYLGLGESIYTYYRIRILGADNLIQVTWEEDGSERRVYIPPLSMRINLDNFKSSCTTWFDARKKSDTEQGCFGVHLC